MRYSFRPLYPLLIAVSCCGSLLPSVSQAVSYTITIDTQSLAGQPTPPAPFALEFQLNGGDGTVNNTVTLSNFNFGARGSAIGSPTTTGGASGNLVSTVTLTDTTFLSEFIQGFTPSSTDQLSFLLDLTTNVEPTTPDSFSLAIFDGSGTGIPTNFFDVFIQADITTPLTINTYASDTSSSPPGCSTCPALHIAAPLVTTTTSPVPEPNTLMLLAGGVGCLVFLRRRHVRRPTF